MLKVAYWRPILLVLLSSSPFGYIKYVVCFYIGCINIYKCYIPLMNWSLLSLYHILLCLLLSFRFIFTFLWGRVEVYFVWCKYCYTRFILVPYAGHIFFHPFILCVCVFLKVKWVFSRQHIIESFLFVFLSIQLLFVFWLENLVCLHLK